MFSITCFSNCVNSDGVRKEIITHSVAKAKLDL